MSSKLYTKLVDLDLTLVRSHAKNNYNLRGAKPIRKNVQLVKKWRDEGNRIVIYTARDWWQEEVIAGWLISQGIPFTKIICGKPVGEIWDDRAFNINCKECLSHA